MIGSSGNVAKVSRCVGCATPIIGERLRCPACHDQHAASVATDASISSPTIDDDVTLPRPRSRRGTSVREAVLAWIGACVIVALAAVFLVVAARSCQ